MEHSLGLEKKTRILMVEDEMIAAMGIKDKLEESGYTVADMVTTARDAIAKAGELRPDIVLMDIVLKGDMDGIEAAQIIRREYDIPVLYLTAYSDNKTLQRAKITEPYGYILKPVEQRELIINIEIALYKHRMEKKLEESQKWLLATLKLMGCALITTDTRGKVTFINQGASQITGWKAAEAIGEHINKVLNTGSEHVVLKALEEGIIISKNCTLINRHSVQKAINFSAISIVDAKGNNIGVAVTIHNVDICK